MKQLMIIRVTILLVMLLVASAAFAQNPHYLRGSPQVTFGATTVSASGSIAGLGNQDITVVLTAVGSRTVQCRNPGGNIAPGQTQQISTSGTVTDIRVENGRANFSVTTEEPAVPGPESCPNGRWTVIPGPVVWESATLTVYQGGQVVLQSTHYPQP